MQANRHEGRTVVVTGGSSGIGRGIALRFAEEGANIVNADIRRDPAVGEYYGPEDERPTDVLVREEHAGTAFYAETDVSDNEDVKRLINETLSQFDTIDVLVNNAGIFLAGNSQDIDIEDWESVIGINLEGVFYCSKAAIPSLKASEGHLINIGSVHATEGGGGPPYASAKAAVVNLTRDLAVELGPHEVNVNAICPGFIETPIQDYLSDEDIEAALEHTLLPRGGLPKDIGDAAVFLACDEASFVHGEALYVDGGWTAHRM